MSNTDHLALPFIDAAQAQKHVTHNAALNLLDCVVQLSISARNVLAPPGTPLEGQRLLLGTGATGAFAGHDGTIATFQDGAWGFLTPMAGWRAYSEAENLLLMYNGTAWVDVMSTLKQAQNLSLLGLNTTATAQNPLSATLNSALFAALPVAASGTGDMRMVLNKAAPGNTVSQLYQDNFSGRAETGLTDDDHFHVKVSSDGTTWREAINIDNSTGKVSFPSGAALQPSLLTFRNRLHNAMFTVNQRRVSGTVMLAAGAYGHDRWKAGAAGCTYAFATSGNGITLTITAGSLKQVVENFNVEGGAYYLSWTGTAQGRVDTGAFAASGLLATGIAGGLPVTVEFGVGTLSMPQFEPQQMGQTGATIFEQRPLSFELALCQRYYFRRWNNVGNSSTIALLARVGVYTTGRLFGFPVPLRAVPTVKISGIADFGIIPVGGYSGVSIAAWYGAGTPYPTAYEAIVHVGWPIVDANSSNAPGMAVTLCEMSQTGWMDFSADL